MGLLFVRALFINACVTLDQIPCGSPQDPPGLRAYTWGIHRGSAEDLV